MTAHNVHLAIQIVPLSKSDHPYNIIDKAIAVIASSKLPYQVGPMETVIEGPYDQVMEVAKKAQAICFDEGADEIIVTMKVHARKKSDITWEEKLKKYS